MTATATKLSDLISRRREGTDAVATAAGRLPASPAAMAVPEPDGNGQETQSSVISSAVCPEPVGKDLEMLALKLYAISRQKRREPEQMMREALRSIEACLLAIKKQH